MAPAKKLTITIPEELAERILPWRDRLNLSEIATAAIQNAVTELSAEADIQTLFRSEPGFFDLLRRFQNAVDKCDDDYTETPEYQELWELIDAYADEDIGGAIFEKLEVIAQAQFGKAAK